MSYRQVKEVNFPDDFYQRVIDYICEDERITQELANEYYNANGELESFCNSLTGKAGLIIEACEGANKHNDWCFDRDWETMTLW